MSTASRLDEVRYRVLLGKTLPVVIRTEAEYRRTLGAIEALMDKHEEEISEEEGRLLELLARCHRFLPLLACFGQAALPRQVAVAAQAVAERFQAPRQVAGTCVGARLRGLAAAAAASAGPAAPLMYFLNCAGAWL